MIYEKLFCSGHHHYLKHLEPQIQDIHKGFHEKKMEKKAE
jgi:hypothetical protein